MLYQSEGIVLDQNDLGENDKLAIIFTRQEGLVRAVVKGAGRPQSKLRGLTQPFTHSIFQFFRGRTFDRVTQASVQHAYPGIMEDYDKMVYARYIAELLISVLPERAKDQNQFDFLLVVLSCLERKDDPWVVVRWAELGILSMAGFAPSFSYCTSCGKVHPEPPVYFSLRDGGAICSDCIGEAVSQSVPQTVSQSLSLGITDGGTSSSRFSSESQVRSYGEIISISPGALRTLEILADEITSTEFPARARCPNISAWGQVRREITAVSRKYISFVLEKRLKSANLVESIEDEK
ncbi:MAG: DNA repair protein RecO [Bacillota bacterium]